MSAHDRIKYCQPDFDSAISRLKRQRFMTQNDLSYEMTSLTIDFFNKVRLITRERLLLLRAVK